MTSNRAAILPPRLTLRDIAASNQSASAGAGGAGGAAAAAPSHIAGPLLRPKRTAPVFLCRDSVESILWRIRNLPWPAVSGA